MHSWIFDSWPKYLLHFLTNPPRSPFCWLLNQLLSYLVYVSKSKSFQEDFLHKWLYQCFFWRTKSQRRPREQTDHLLSLSSSGHRLPAVLLPGLFSSQPVTTNKTTMPPMWHLSGESMIQGHVTLPFTHLYVEENRTLPQTSMDEASKAPPGSRGLCITLPHNITSPHNSSI